MGLGPILFRLSASCRNPVRDENSGESRDHGDGWMDTSPLVGFRFRQLLNMISGGFTATRKLDEKELESHTLPYVKIHVPGNCIFYMCIHMISFDPSDPIGLILVVQEPEIETEIM